MWSLLQRVSRSKQVLEGTKIRAEDFVVPFKQNMNMTTAMFEVRKWFILNSPHKHYAGKYSNEMALLHNELNYLHSKLLIKRGLLVFGTIFGYFWFISEPDAIDWRDTFDLKMSERTYGSLTSSSGEGGSSMDD